MAIKYGFYDSVDGDRVYNASHFGTIFDGIINDGVFAGIGGQFLPTAKTGRLVTIAPGRAWFNGTWTFNDAEVDISIPAASLIEERKDIVVLEINKSTDVRANSIKLISGVTGSTETIVAGLTRDILVNQYPLFIVTCPANSTEVLQTNIEILIGTSYCPFSIGVQKNVTTDELITAWQVEFFNWLQALETTLSGDVAGNLQANIDAKPSVLFGLDEVPTEFAGYVKPTGYFYAKTKPAGADPTRMSIVSLTLGDTVIIKEYERDSEWVYVGDNGVVIGGVPSAMDRVFLLRKKCGAQRAYLHAYDTADITTSYPYSNLDNICNSWELSFSPYIRKLLRSTVFSVIRGTSVGQSFANTTDYINRKCIAPSAREVFSGLTGVEDAGYTRLNIAGANAKPAAFEINGAYSQWWTRTPSSAGYAVVVTAAAAPVNATAASFSAKTTHIRPMIAISARAEVELVSEGTYKIFDRSVSSFYVREGSHWRMLT